jgi:hypothetical protein
MSCQSDRATRMSEFDSDKTDRYELLQIPDSADSVNAATSHSRCDDVICFSHRVSI